MIYLDNNSTTKPYKSVVEKANELLVNAWANPSSSHKLGQEAKRAIEEARETICALLGIKTSELVFTSGGTEANNLAIKGTISELITKGSHIITSSIEHSSILKTCNELEENGIEVTYIDPDKNGIISAKDVEKAIKKETILISIMDSNNEIGTIQPIDEIGKLAKKHGIIFHVDGVQSIGKKRIDLTNIDLFSFSAHKFYGLKGSGALFIKRGVKISKDIFGGSQERNRRGGTENSLGIATMAIALEETYRELYPLIEKETLIRDHFEKRIVEEIENTFVNGSEVNRLPNTSSITFVGASSQSLLFTLDMKGICVSAGSACASGSLTPSHVLQAIGLSENDAKSTIRFSLGKDNTIEEIDEVVDILKQLVKKEREFSLF